MFKNKNGVGSLLIIILVAVILVVGVGAYVMTRPQEALKSQKDIVTELGTCDVEPYFTQILTDRINAGTSIASTKSPAIVNGAYIGDVTPGSSGTILSIGDDLNLLVNGTNYVTEEGSATISKCGENEVSYTLCKLDGAPSMTIFGPDGNALTDDYGGGAVNVTATANTFTVDLHFTMPSDECADSVVFVVEASNTTEVDKIGMSANLGTIAPVSNYDVHAVEGQHSTSITKTFLAKGFSNDGGKTIYTITFDPESTITMGTGNSTIYVSAYFPQAFVDVDGTIKTDIQNEDGTATHVTAAIADYDFCIGGLC